MISDLSEIRQVLISLLQAHCPPLKIRNNSDQGFEVAGTKEAMQGKQKVDGYYFASVVPKPKDIRLYFFPIYTHANAFTLSDELKKARKGKSCFHIKKISSQMEEEVKSMIALGVELYQKDELI